MPHLPGRTGVMRSPAPRARGRRSSDGNRIPRRWDPGALLSPYASAYNHFHNRMASRSRISYSANQGGLAMSTEWVTDPATGGGPLAVFTALREKHGWNFETMIGEGGSAYVYRECVNKFFRAVKISKSPLTNPELRQQADREFEALRKSQGHPRLLTLIDYEFVHGHLVTVWELADGTLESELCEQQRISGDSGVPIEQLLQWMREAAEAVDFLNHDKQIYHRDIKPHNLFLVQGHVKLGDLGLAKSAEATTSSHTGSGTLGYSPPEAMLKGRQHQSIDVYGLAATYLRLRTGRLPFGKNTADIISRIKNGRFEAEGLRPAERDCLARALSPDPDERFESARELVGALTEAVSRRDSVRVPLPVAVRVRPEPEEHDTQQQLSGDTAALSAVSTEPVHEASAAFQGRSVRDAVLYLAAFVALIGLLCGLALRSRQSAEHHAQVDQADVETSTTHLEKLPERLSR
ncbi:MAG: serine/threonine protein kinase [Planctomycetota bacterium]|nr:MAG: serine/threonine protein kinase [Planctomycetota bacterium]